MGKRRKKGLRFGITYVLLYLEKIGVKLGKLSPLSLDHNSEEAAMATELRKSLGKFKEKLGKNKERWVKVKGRKGNLEKKHSNLCSKFH